MRGENWEEDTVKNIKWNFKIVYLFHIDLIHFFDQWYVNICISYYIEEFSHLLICVLFTHECSNNIS